MISYIEVVTPRICRRIHERAPDLSTVKGSLLAAVNAVLDPEAEHWKRRGDKVALFLEDMMALAQSFPGCPLGDHLVHHCWLAATGRPCCRNDEEFIEKATVLLVNACFARSDVIPAEGTWTHVLEQLQMLILLALPKRIGLHAMVPA